MLPTVRQFAVSGSTTGETRVATLVTLLAQVEDNVTSLVELSLYVPVAVKPTADPTNCVGFVGVTAMLTSVGVGVWQVSVVFPLVEPLVAVIKAVPAATQVTTSGSTTGDATVAWLEVPEVHVVFVVLCEIVQSLVEPSE